jgi:hypothetical protein
MKTYGGGIAPPFLTSVLDGDESSPSRPCRFTPEEKVLYTHCIGDWVGPGNCMEAVEKRKTLHCRKSNPGPPARTIPIESYARDHVVKVKSKVVPVLN